MESLKLEYQQLFCIKNLGSVYYVINLGMQHYKIWKFYIHSKYLPPYLTKYMNEFLQLSILPVTIVQKQEDLSIYF